MKKLLIVLAATMTAVVTRTALAEVGSVVSAQNRVSIVASDASAGTVTLAFGGERSDSVLYIARDDADKGATPGAWADVKPLACVKATDTSYVCNVPVEIRRKGGMIRFFLVQPDESLPYFTLVDYIRPTTTSSEYNYNTGIVPKQTTGITLDFQVTGDSPDEISVFGVWMKCGMILQASRSFHSVPGIDTTVCTYLSAADLGHQSARMGAVRHQLVFERGTFLDGEPIRDTKEGSSPANPANDYKGGYDHPMADGLNTMRLFQTIENKTAYSASGMKNNNPAVRIYGFDVRENGTPVASLRPCVSKEGVPCFWDSVRKTLIGPSKKDAATTDACYTFGMPVGDATEGEVSASDALEIGMEFGWRKITVSAEVGSSELTLTFAGSGAKHLYVAHDTKDRGADPAAWADVEAVADIPADATSFVYAIPEKWQGVDHTLRFFLSSPSKFSVYDGLELYQWVYHGSTAGFIDTGIVPDRTTKLSLDLRFDKDYTYERGIVGIWPYLGTFSQTSTMFVNLPGIDTTISEYLMAEGAGTTAWGEKRQVLRIGCDEFSYNGVQQKLYNSDARTLYAGTFTNERIPQTMRTLPLFKLINDSNGSDVKNNCGNTWLYGCDIVTNGGVHAAHLIPAKLGSYVGLYDEVGGRFLYPNSGTTFSVGGGTRGPALTAAACESSALFRQVRTVTVVSIDRSTGSVTLAFGGKPLDGTIFALRSRDGDRGDDPADWDEVLPLGAVGAQEREKTLANVLPRQWMRKGGAIRFVVAQMPAYETRLEWAGNSETDSWGQYILTDYHPTVNCEITIKARHRVGDYVPFGIYYNSKYELLYGLPHGNDFYAGFFGDQQTVKSPTGGKLDFIVKYDGKTIDETPPYELRISKDGLWFPDLNTQAYGAFTPTSRWWLNPDGSSPYGLCLFGAAADGNRCKYNTPIRIYFVTAKESGGTVFDLVPVVKDGIVCFYDKAHGEFVKNSGTGAFVAGPDIGYQLDEAEVCGDLSDPAILRPMGLFVVVK